MFAERHAVIRQVSRFWLLVVTVAFLLGTNALTARSVLAQAPGGFLEQSSSNAVRPRLSASQIQGLLPARGLFTFPAPYMTQGIRITNATDCAGGTDCVLPVGYSYWRNMNNHMGSNTMLVYLTLSRSSGGGGPTLFSVDKTTNAVTVVGPLFDPSAPLSWASGEGWYFSGTRPNTIYLNEALDSRLLRYDVRAKTFETVFDVASQPGLFGTNRYIWQFHSSDDDKVHSATVRDKTSYANLGCFVYNENTAAFTYFPQLGLNYDECHIDKSGRWLTVLEKVSAGPGQLDNRVIDITIATGSRSTDLASGAERVVLDPNGASGHLDTGYGYIVGGDNYDSHSNAYKLWKYSANPLNGVLVHYNMDWNDPGPIHVSHLNARPSVPAEQQFACGSSAWRTNLARSNEVICFPLDGSQRVLVVAPVMTDMDAAGGGAGNDYNKYPKGNIDVTGQYFIWTSNTGGNRMDAFAVRVPSQLLQLAAPPAPPTNLTIVP